MNPIPAEPSATPVLALDGVAKRLGTFALGPVDLRFGPGVNALLGANGAGKTTLLRLAVGLLAPDGGEITVGSLPVRRTAGSVGYLPQDFTAPGGVRVRDYLRFIAWCRSGRGRRFGDDDVLRALAAVGLDSKAGAKLRTLSGGMVRRVGIAQALIGHSGALVLDEPTVGLDPLQRRELRDLLTELGSHTSVIVSTHLSEDVAAVASHVVVLQTGTKVFDGTVDELVTRGGGTERSGDAVERGFLAAIGDQR